jgi:hypothetical protein
MCAFKRCRCASCIAAADEAIRLLSLKGCFDVSHKILFICSVDWTIAFSDGLSSRIAWNEPVIDFSHRFSVALVLRNCWFFPQTSDVGLNVRLRPYPPPDCSASRINCKGGSVMNSAVRGPLTLILLNAGSLSLLSARDAPTVRLCVVSPSTWAMSRLPISYADTGRGAPTVCAIL